jgi:hypothetical protein
MNETYQHPGKWHDQILHPSVQRHDSRHFVMSYIIIALEHNSVYEVMVQAKNMYGWNEVRAAFTFMTKTREEQEEWGREKDYTKERREKSINFA